MFIQALQLYKQDFQELLKKTFLLLKMSFLKNIYLSLQRAVIIALIGSYQQIKNILVNY